MPRLPALLAACAALDEVQIMDEPLGEFDEVWEPRFIDGGRKLAFGARQGRDLGWKVVSVPP